MNSFDLPTGLQYTLADICGIVRDVTHLQLPASKAAGTNIVDLHGLILTRAQVQLIFWGSGWTRNATLTASDVIKAAQTILSGPYMSKLSQYRGISNATLLEKLVIDPTDPPNPFSTDDIAQCVIPGLLEDKV